MNFLKGSLFRRNTELEEPEPMEESGGGILAVWGSPGCGKTVTAVKIAKHLAAQKKNTVLLLCDMTAPMMPCICPPSELEVDKSLGSIFAAQHISVNLIKHNLTTLKRLPHLTMLGLRKKENEYLARQDKITALKELISGSRIEPGLCNKLFHKNLFHSLLHDDIMPLDIKVNEDFFMNYLLFKEAEQTVYEDFCPYHYILRKGSAATSANRIHITDPIRVNELVKADVQGNEYLYPVAYSRYIYTLVGAASQRRWKEESHCAREKLKWELHTGSLRLYCSARTRLMAFGTAYLLPLYRGVRWGYDRITGVSKKYNV